MAVIIRDNFCFCIKTYVVAPHLNHLEEIVQMRGHNIRFKLEKRKIIIKYMYFLLSGAASRPEPPVGAPVSKEKYFQKKEKKTL